MGKQKYETCPRFGDPKCCGTHHQRTIDRIAGVEIELEFKDSRTIKVHPWVVVAPGETADSWTALRQHNPDYEAIDVKALTQGSRVRYARYHHWGKVITTKLRDCPKK